MGRFPQGSGGGSGTIEELTSTGHTVTITDATGPVTNLEAAAAAVASVFGRTGSIVASSGDYSVGEVTGAQAGPLTGDVTTSGAAATLVATGNVDAIVAAHSAVTTVFGRAGSVVATSGDYSVGEVTGAQAGPLTGDVTTSGAAATLVGTANVENIIRSEQVSAPVIFTATGTWTPSTTGLALFAALVVGGGGGGVNGTSTLGGGAGGGGEVLPFFYLGNVTGNQTVTIGAGGAGGATPAAGGATSIGSLVTAHGGNQGVAIVPGYGGVGGDGSSGGESISGAVQAWGSGGGGSFTTAAGGGGGGGYQRFGAGGGGGGTTNNAGGRGGGGGNGGGGNNAGGAGVTGAGGGGGAGGLNPTAPTAGSGTVGGAGGIAAANTGGGGGGGGAGTTVGAGGAGGSGYVVIFQIA